MKLSLAIILCLLISFSSKAQPEMYKKAESSKDTSVINFSIKNGNRTLYGLKQSSGKIILQAIYSDIIWYDGGEWAYLETHNSKTGVATGMIDKTGKILIIPTPEYCGILPNGDGTIVADNCTENKEYRVIFNKKGKLITPQKFISVSPFVGGIAIVSIKDKSSKKVFAHIDTAGRYITLFSEKNVDVGGFSEGLAMVKRNDKCGYVNMKGVLVIPATYDEAKDFAEGLAVVKIKEMYGYINSKGSLVIPAVLAGAESFINGKAEVLIIGDGKTGYYEIDKNGKVLRKLRNL